MKKLLSAAAIVAISSTTAFAADLPVRTKAPAYLPPVPVYSWTGFYLGGHLGAGWSRNEFSEPQANGILAPGTDLGSHNGLGPLGGFQVGYNWQLPNAPVVIGVEGDFSFADLKGDHQNSASAAFADNFLCGRENQHVCSIFALLNGQERFSSKVKDTATITGRIGVTSGPEDRTLWYVKGGAAWAKTDFADSATVSALLCINVPLDSACFAANADAFASGNRSRWGWTVGTGVEWALWQNWSTKIEYDFLDFGSHDVALNGTFGNGNTFDRTVHVDQQIHQIKVGLNYRFNWGKAPVAARY